jgi:cell division protease FtsH
MTWLGQWRRRLAPRWRDIDVRLARHVGRARMRRMQTCVRELPAFRLVDLARSIAAALAELRLVATVASEHPDEDLKDVLTGAPPRWIARAVNVAARVAWPVGPGQSEYHAKDCFWLARRSGNPAEWLVLRLRHRERLDRAALEVAAETSASAEALLEQLVERATRASIFRGRLLTVSFEPGVKDEYGDVECAARLNILFRAVEPVPPETFIIDEPMRAVLQRNVVDLHRQRALLKAHGVPVRRGILLHGPPGTGKTFTCRYLCDQLPEVTRFVVAGTSLPHVRSIFNLARLLQPSLVILEDVDLVFTARDMAGNGAGLGELLDHLDGLRPFDDVNVILTTNALDRLEAALKDRPGRISQCIHVGPPNDALRRRYLLAHLARYGLDELDLDELVRRSHGATQAFLKEWVHRAAQIALERPLSSARLAPRTEDFRRALAEMRQDSNAARARLIGFRDSALQHGL